jgi:hypothetical protein
MPSSQGPRVSFAPRGDLVNHGTQLGFVAQLDRDDRVAAALGLDLGVGAESGLI